MRTLAFDGRIGAAGDMLLGALLAAGADREALSPVEDALDVEYAVSAVDRSGIAATRVDVLLSDADDVDDSHDDQSHSHSHDHDEGHGHAGDDDAHPHTHEDHDHTHAEGRGPSRTYAEVVELVGEMDLPATVRTDALAIFEILGEAEASVHGTDLDDTHFHEVGADDAIADIVGVCLLLDDLDIERVVTTPLATGGGTVEMSHGSYPVPTPAVVAIAEQADWSLQGGPIDRELLTPTGAAILAHIADGTDSLPPLDLDASGYGAGGWDLDDRPNVLRAMVGDGAGRLRRDEITVLETNVDDVPPEVLGDLQRSLPDVGARDVSIVPTTMKKSRPGHIVKVICRPEDAERVARCLAEATGTLGVRESGAGHRWVADREYKTVALSVDGEQFEVTVKVASDTDGTVFDVSAEYDDAAAVADATGLPVRAVMQRAERMVRE
ncbi:nickel pincer cofactor biosynthesis protein LarC [Haloarcula sp. Atlit-7R]|uniref:nickel pincer cofactor biosynthesis protein LarC n=1 Tax=Haloarcula sp. Atlit-7R TaxID=2282125 RepID=UPI000EF1508E|nr:nickel pincer cofactor biosynthesis protein LarC [Haloarcula sp. Atlit-7R]RLM89958.1 nickel pincer cofactor biosynthesis protein LarC [Haloarcula sp. Atlit-7R]